MRTKFFLLAAVFFSFVCVSNAQINKGKYLAGGSFNLYNAKNGQNLPDSKTRSFNSTLQIGNVVSDNTIVGLIASYGSSASYYPPNFADTNKNSHYTAGIFFRKYKKLSEKFYFFGEMDAAYMHAESTATYNQTISKSSSGGALISFIPGISFAVSKSFQLELSMPDLATLSYTHVKTDIKTDPSAPHDVTTGNVVSANANLNSNLLSSFGIGFKFLFGK